MSAAAVEAAPWLRAAMPLLSDLRIPFKLPRSLADVVFVNSGDGGSALLGKVLTLYPSDDSQARIAIERFDALWPTSRGPEVQTDLHLRPGSPVSFRYGVFRATRTVASSTGILAFALAARDGELFPDTPSHDGTQAPQTPTPPVPAYPPTTLPVRLNEPLALGERRYVALARLADTPRAQTFLGADLETLRTVVLKVGRPGVAGDSTGADIRDLLEREFSILCSLEIECGLAPRALQWSNHGAPILVTEDFRGEPLCDLPREESVASLPALAEAVARLHARCIIHGDVKLENALRRQAAVGLIDFELAAPMGADARTGGTRGHLAPEARKGAAADAARDVYALGACVAQAILGIPPTLLPEGRGRLSALLGNEGVFTAGRVVRRMMHPAPERRPSAALAAAALHAEAAGWSNIRPAEGRRTLESGRRWCRRASTDAALLAASFQRTGEQCGGWRNEHFQRAFDCEAINLGAAGIVLGLLTIDVTSQRTDFAGQAAAGAAWLAGRPVAGNGAGLYTGNAGVAVALAAAGQSLGHWELVEAAHERFEAACDDGREVDLFSGDAGVVWASCLLYAATGNARPLQRAEPLVRRLLGDARCERGIPIWRRGATQDVPYLGCAHGSAGIAMALASWSRATGESDGLELARETFRRLARDGRGADGHSLRVRLDRQGHHAVGNWCHGVAGLLWALLQGLGDDPASRTEIDWAVGCLARATSVGTSTYCHGLAGQLELWRMLGAVQRHAALAEARAGKCAMALRFLHRKVDGRCTWGSEDPETVTPDLWVGFLGPATALAMHAAGRCEALLSPAWLAALAAGSHADLPSEGT